MEFDKGNKITSLLFDIAKGNNILNNYNRNEAINFISNQFSKNIETQFLSLGQINPIESYANDFIKERIRKIILVLNGNLLGEGFKNE